MPIVILALLTAQAASAPACPATPAPLPADLAGWQAMVPQRAAAAADAAPTLAVGRGATVALVPSASLRLAHPLAKPAAAQTFGGLLAFDVARAGRYRVALGGGAWIDVVRDRSALASVAHGHGPACSPVRKMVDFDLVPGRYLLQIAGSPAATLPLMVVPRPAR